MPLFFWDPTYVIILPDIVLAFYAQLRIQCAYGRCSRVPTFRKLTGAEVARARWPSCWTNWQLGSSTRGKRSGSTLVRVHTPEKALRNGRPGHVAELRG